MQPCFFALTDVMELDRAVGAIKASISAAYGRRGRLVVERNEAAVDRALAELAEVPVPSAMPPSTELDETLDILDSARENAETDFVDRVTMTMIANQGDLLPVSAMPIDGTFPTGTTTVREAQARDRDPDLGARPLHRLRQVRRRVPACDDPDEGLRADRARRRTRRVPRPRASARANSTATSSRSRSRPTTARAAASASTCALPRTRPRSSARRSTCARRPSTGWSSASVGTSSRRSPNSTERRSRTTR